MRRYAWALCCLLVFPALHMEALACIHPPMGFPGRLTEREKAAFLFHDGTNAHLVIRTSIASDAGLPERMAWVIPFPSLPSKYAEVEGGLFEELARLIPRVRQQPARAIGDGKMAAAKKAEAPKPAAIQVHEAQVVGNYRVQPIEILSESAAGELNAWLTRNGFDPVSEHSQKYYLKKGAAFLTVRVDGLKGNESGLKPLHIVYRDERMRLPLKFSGHSGVFDVRLYALTEQPPARRVLDEFGLKVRDASYRLNDDFEHRAPIAAKLVGARAGYLTEFAGTDYNRQRSVAEMPEDPWLTRTGAGRGGEPGGPDNAAIAPSYPLIAVDNALPNGAASQRKGLDAGVLFMGSWLILAILGFAATARHVASHVRKPSPSRWRGMGNQAMLAGVAACLLAIPLWYLIMEYRIWGMLAEDAPSALLYLGLALFTGGVVVRIAAIWIDEETPAPDAQQDPK